MNKNTRRKKESVFLGDEIGEYLDRLKVVDTRNREGGTTNTTGWGDTSKKVAAKKEIQKSMNLLACWQQTAPAHLLKHTDNVVYSTQSKKTEILVFVDSGAYAAELTMDKELYRFKMQQILEKEIDDIKFLVSRKTSFRTRQA